jgi:hypothetical protein
MAKASLKKVEDVSSIVTILEQEIKSFEHISDSKYKTSGQVEGFNNIKEETNIGNLIKTYSSVDSREKAYNNSAEEMGLSTYPQFQVNGSSAEDIKCDIKLRISIITHKETLDKLNDFKTQAKALMTKEEQKNILFSEMATFLASLKK